MTDSFKQFWNVIKGRNDKEEVILPINAELEIDLCSCLFTGTREFSTTAMRPTNIDSSHITKILSQCFQVTNRETAINLLENLRDQGNRWLYEILLPIYLANKDPLSVQRLINKKLIATEKMQVYANNLINRLPRFHEKSILTFEESDLQNGILCWDMGEMIIVGRFAFEAGYLSEMEAKEYITLACYYTHLTFKDGKKAAISYLLGKAMLQGDSLAFEHALECLCKVLDREERLWK